MKKVIYVAITAFALSSCGTSSYQCAAYATNDILDCETEAIHENLTQAELQELISCENCDEID